MDSTIELTTDEMKIILAWRETLRIHYENNRSNRPLRMLVEQVPVGKRGGIVRCHHINGTPIATRSNGL